MLTCPVAVHLYPLRSNVEGRLYASLLRHEMRHPSLALLPSNLRGKTQSLKRHSVAHKSQLRLLSAENSGR